MKRISQSTYSLCRWDNADIFFYSIPKVELNWLDHPLLGHTLGWVTSPHSRGARSFSRVPVLSSSPCTWGRKCHWLTGKDTLERRNSLAFSTLYEEGKSTAHKEMNKKPAHYFGWGGSRNLGKEKNRKEGLTWQKARDWQESCLKDLEEQKCSRSILHGLPSSNVTLSISLKSKVWYIQIAFVLGWKMKDLGR